jgi:hypothetical protein
LSLRKLSITCNAEFLFGEIEREITIIVDKGGKGDGKKAKRTLVLGVYFCSVHIRKFFYRECGIREYPL